MSADKYPCIFSRQMAAIVYLLKTGSLDEAIREFSSAKPSWVIYRLTQSASELSGFTYTSSLKALAKKDTLLPTQMFPRLPARNICCGHTKKIADTNFVSGTQKMFLVLFRNILCPQHHGQQCVRNNVPSFARALTMNEKFQSCTRPPRAVLKISSSLLVNECRYSR